MVGWKTLLLAGILLMPWGIVHAKLPTDADYDTLKADILNDPTLADEVAAEQDAAIAEAYNVILSPTVWGWRTDVTLKQVYSQTSVDQTVWDWTVYIAQTVREADAWVQMFTGGTADFSLAQNRTALTKIFKAPQGTDQHNHILAIARRAVRRIENLLKTGGAGTTADPIVMTYQGVLTASDVSCALRGGGCP